MVSPGADPEHLLTRLTTVSVVLHGLLHRLTAKGQLAPADVAEIELFALDLARDLRDHTASGPQVAGARLEEDVRSFFAALQPDDEADAEPEDTWPTPLDPWRAAHLLGKPESNPSAAGAACRRD